MKFLGKLLPCKHKYWSAVDDRGYQFCIECNEAKFVGLSSCIHQWENNFERGIQTCLRCGEIKTIPISCNHKWEVKDNKKICSICGEVECLHFWEQTKQYSQTRGDINVDIITIYTCKYCGEIKKEHLSDS